MTILNALIKTRCLIFGHKAIRVVDGMRKIHDSVVTLTPEGMRFEGFEIERWHMECRRLGCDWTR